ncbi:hypothetical protein JWR97_11350 [Pseudomonas cedrina subsp. fulgida]|nr:hypothetical protein [Pseudomonas cedrina subsp. fulgida]
MNGSQLKTPPDYFYAGLHVLLIDIIQVGFFWPQCMGCMFCSPGGVPLTVFKVNSMKLLNIFSFLRAVNFMSAVEAEVKVSSDELGCHTSWRFFTLT